MLPQLHQHSWMDSDIEAYRDQVRRYIANEMTPHNDAWREQGYVPREIWQGFGEMGFLLPEISEEYGGAGAPLSYQLVALDELARAGMPPSTAVHSIATHYILDYGTEEQKQKWIPRLASGELFAAIAMTEPDCGSDLKTLRTRARRDGDEYVIDGSKTFITNGYSGNLVVIAVRTSDDGAKGISLVVIETGNLKGYSVNKLKKIGLHGSDTCEMFFDGVRVPVANLLGPVEGNGFIQLMSQLCYERMLLAVPAVAVMERALELATDYAKERRMFGQKLFDLQNTKFKLAECATITHIARTFVNDCTQRLLDGKLDPQAAYMAKLWCSDMQCKVTDELLQLFGGYGYMDEYPIARMFVDSRVQKIYGGANEVMKDLIARQL
ncbi:acyl-CoA dehydrogenase [Pseudomonas sp. GW456-E7]|nr:acyl-CoA dehydrogenase [Pseudomonas sp. GW456-E7]